MEFPPFRSLMYLKIIRTNIQHEIVIPEQFITLVRKDCFTMYTRIRIMDGLVVFHLKLILHFGM